MANEIYTSNTINFDLAEAMEPAEWADECAALRAENDWLVERRANDDRVICGLYARVAELEARLLNLVTAVELSSAVVVSQSVSEAMADARTTLAKEGE